MPTVRLEYEVRETTPANDAYQVDVEVRSADNIDLEIFVFDTEYQAFIGVSTVFGLLNYPRTRDAALQQGISFFRAIGVSRTYDAITTATEFAALTKSRIESLRIAWQDYLDRYVTSEIITTPA